MHRSLCGALIALLGCGGHDAAPAPSVTPPPPPPSSIVAPAVTTMPTRAPAREEGMALADAQAAYDAVFQFLARADDGPLPDATPALTALWPRPILFVDADAPRMAVCHASVSPDEATPLAWSCDADITRCVAEYVNHGAPSFRHVFAFDRVGADRRVLTTVIDYGAVDAVPDALGPELERAIRERDDTCWMLDRFLLTPSQFTCDAFVDVVPHAAHDATATVTCGAGARARCAAIASQWTRYDVVCGRFECSHAMFVYREGQQALHAERDAEHRVRFLAEWLGPAEWAPSFTSARAELAVHPCPRE